MGREAVRGSYPLTLMSRGERNIRSIEIGRV